MFRQLIFNLLMVKLEDNKIYPNIPLPNWLNKDKYIPPEETIMLEYIQSLQDLK